MRAQAAIEYLITYGWAILLLAVAVTLLLATGRFSLSSLIAEECNLGSTLPCNAQLYQAGDDLKLVVNISNGFSYKIGIKEVKFTLQDEDISKTISPLDVIESGSSIKLNTTFPHVTVAKDSIKKVKVELTYYSCAPQENSECNSELANYVISGRIISRVS
jgi:hypothetical protein